MQDEKIIYRLDDNISFRKCSLYGGGQVKHGDCTNYSKREINWTEYSFCEQDGIHLHCTKDPEVELEVDTSGIGLYLICPKCKNKIAIESLRSIYSSCQKLLNMKLFKNAKLVRLDDWYTHEIKEKTKLPSDYWITTQVKTDKDGDTIVILYVGKKGQNDKSQFFIKPEKLQLTSDHKDLDPSSILSKIEVTLKDRTLTQKFDGKE